tara:strand:- start:56 stop:520 length:465 start_codon:yes stop_codon:yes gene_type:complete
MKKKLFSILIFLFLSSCGYEAVYSIKNMIRFDFSIGELNFTGDRQTNLQIKQELNGYTQVTKGTNFILTISSTSEKTILTKDSSGDATNFEIKTTVNVDVFASEDLKGDFIFIESFNYNNNSDKFELKSYEKEIKRNLARAVAKRLTFKLANFK